jgi:hypothetical protein
LEPGFCASPETSRSRRADAQFGNGAGERVFFARVIVPACIACAWRDPRSRALRAPRYPPLHVRAVVPSTGVARMRRHGAHARRAASKCLTDRCKCVQLPENTHTFRRPA